MSIPNYLFNSLVSNINSGNGLTIWSIIDDIYI